MGRKFALAGIEGSICNWASENTAKVDLDNIQSLKQFITGDPIDIERKAKDSYEYKPAAIFFANCNKLPSITGERLQLMTVMASSDLIRLTPEMRSLLRAIGS
jgi:phage/plasmid-associated DNA primase